jgi:hypothetical protein
MNKSLVQREWIVPTLESILDTPAAKAVTRFPLNFINHEIGGLALVFSNDGALDIKLTALPAFVTISIRLVLGPPR